MIRIVVNRNHEVMRTSACLWARQCLVEQLEDQTVSEIWIESETGKRVLYSRIHKVLMYDLESLDYETCNEVFKNGSHFDKEVYAGYLLMKVHGVDNRKGMLSK